MNDEALGLLAKALLADLANIHGPEGRVIAVARVIAHARDCGRDDAMNSTEHAVKWADPKVEIARAAELAKLREQGADVPEAARPRAPRLEEVVQHAAAGNAMARRLIDTAPGPVTRYARAMLLASLPAQFAAQCGERVEYNRVMYWISQACAGLQASMPEGMTPRESIFDVLCLLALIGSMMDTDSDEYDPEMMIAIARRTAANLGSIARAAARLEGRAECDQIFWIDDTIASSVRGLEPYEARICAAQIAAHVGAHSLAVVSAEDLAKHRAHIASCNPKASGPKPPPRDSIAERSARTSTIRAARLAAKRTARPPSAR